MEEIAHVFRPRPGKLEEFCIEVPIKEFNGYKLPEIKACIDFEELAQWEIMQWIRMALLFLVICSFIQAVKTTLLTF